MPTDPSPTAIPAARRPIPLPAAIDTDGRLAPVPISPGAAVARLAVDPDAEAQAWVAAFADGWRAPAGPDAFAAHFRPLLSADVLLIQPQLPTVRGRDAFEQQFVRPLFATIPDVRATVERWAARGDSVYIELTLHGTIGRRALSWRACDRVTLRDGLAIERESYFDPTPLLGAVARAPRAWPRFLSARLRALGKPLHRRTR